MIDPTDWETIVPKFVKEAKKVVSCQLVHHLYNDTFDVKIEFIAQTDQAQKAFEQLMRKEDVKTQSCLVNCEGPCHSLVPSTEIIQYGLCNHNICRNCTHQSSKKLYDDLLGCCHPDCRFSHQFITKSSRSGSQGTLVTSLKTESEEDICRVVVVRLRAFSRDGINIIQHKCEMELLSDVDISYIVKKTLEMAGRSSDDVNVIDWFYVPKLRYKKRELVPFRPIDLQRKKIGDLTSEELSIVVADTGIFK